MPLRYSGTCRVCGAALPAGFAAVYERDSKSVRCLECPRTAGEMGTVATDTTGETDTVDTGVAGGSARREHERRQQKREQRIRADHPKLGGLILALTDDPQSTRAWERGAIGEEMLAERLTDLPESTRVLHDRRIPGTRANIDHIVVAPSGIWVIDAKRYKGKRPSLRVEGGILRPRIESLRIDGRDASKLVHGLQSQVSRVMAAIDDTTIAVRGALCFVEADWPLVGGAFTVSGVDVVWPRLLVKRIVEAASTGVHVDALHMRIAAAFPPARS